MAEELYEKNIFDFAKSKNLNLDLFKKNFLLLMLKLWMQGIGILPNYNIKFITKDTIYNLLKSPSVKKSIIEFIIFCLDKEEKSPISSKAFPKKKVKLLDSATSENNKWQAIILNYDTELTVLLRDYIEWEKERTSRPLSIETSNSKNETIYITYKKTRWGNFNLISNTLRKSAQLLYQNEIFSFNDILNGKLLTFYSSQSFNDLSENMQDQIRNYLRNFTQHYILIHKLQNINLDRIAPSKLENSTIQFGENINFGETHILLDTLLDDSNPLIDENVELVAKYRRALLIQIATAARIHEVLLLSHNCIVTNSMGEKFIHFHKTKDSNEHFVKADTTTLEWIEELKILSKRTPILVDDKNVSTPFGDNLQLPRLFLNSKEDNIILPSSINRFLKKLETQLKLKSHFHTHKFRKIHALYLKLIGKDKIDIQFALNQKNIDSQLPYIATKSKKVVNDLKNVALEGVWSHITYDNVGENLITLDQVIKKSISFQTSNEQKSQANNFISNIIEKTLNDLNRLPKNNSETKITGMPMYTHNCTASIAVNCGHTELDCFKCSKYLPDQDKLLEHKAELLRYIVLIAHNTRLAKYDKLEKDFILLNTDELKRKLTASYLNIFSKFSLSRKDGEELQKTLERIASHYYKKNKNTLTYVEALGLLENHQ